MIELLWPSWSSWRVSILTVAVPLDGTVNRICAPVDIGCLCSVVSGTRLPMSLGLWWLMQPLTNSCGSKATKSLGGEKKIIAHLQYSLWYKHQRKKHWLTLFFRRASTISFYKHFFLSALYLWLPGLWLPGSYGSLAKFAEIQLLLIVHSN